MFFLLPRLAIILLCQTRLFHKAVEDPLLLNEILRRAEFRYFSLFEHYNSIRVHDGVDTVRDSKNYKGAFRQHLLLG